MSELTADLDAASRTPAPGTVAIVTMLRRRATVALFDGMFWRSCDSFGPVKCVPAAITSVETPYVYSPVVTDEATP